MANICLQTKFSADRPELDEIRRFMYFQDGGRPPCWICFPYFGPPTTFPLMGYILPVKNMTRVLRFYDFADLAGNCLFVPILAVLGILAPKIVTSLF